MTKSIFITGASRGIGKSVAELFAKSGYTVGFTYLKNQKKAFLLKEEILSMGGICHAYQCDCGDYEKSQFCIDDFARRTKKIDTLVCNASISPYGLIQDMDQKEIIKTFETNVYGTIYACKFAAKHMLAEKYGNIINISSIWGISGASCESIYSATKGAIISFSKSLAKELGPSNIRVNVLAPGMVMTDMIHSLTQEDILRFKKSSALNQISTAEDIAQSVLFLSSNQAQSYTGQILSPNCGSII